MRFLKELPFFLKTGVRTQYGEEKDWIRYKNIFIQIVELEDGSYSVAYQDSPPNHYELKDMLLTIKADKTCEVPF